MVFAYCGEDDALRAIAAAARQDNEVVAVAFDLGQGRSLSVLRDLALAAGAVRCHALDLREEFLRDHVVPALGSGASFDQPAAALASLARPLMDRHLAAIARVEKATVAPAAIVQIPAYATSIGYPFDHPAYLEIAFEAGVPHAINGVTMSVIEVMESLQTIAPVSPFAVLAMAYAELAGARAGLVTIRVTRTGLSVVTPAAVQ